MSRALVFAEWLVLALLASWFANWLTEAMGPVHAQAFVDFRIFYAGGLDLVHRMSPYGEGGFVSPPWFALLIVPFALLPFELAARCWLAFTLGLLVATVVMVSRLLDLRLGIRRAAILVLGLTWWAPVEHHLVLGQNSLLVAASTVGAVLAVERGRLYLAGLLLAVASVKPQLAFLLGPGLALWSWRRYRSVRVMLGGAAALAAALVVCLAITSAWVGDVFKPRPEISERWAWTASSTRTLLARIFETGPVADGLYLAILLVGSGVVLLFWARSGAPLVELAGLTLTATLLLTPYAQTYDYVVLVLPLLLLGARVARAPIPWRWLLLGAVVLGAWAVPLTEVWMPELLLQHWGWLEQRFGEEWVVETWEVLKHHNYGRFPLMLLPLALLLLLGVPRDQAGMNGAARPVASHAR
jgi:hypothetical protein